jgi:TetR/AcrR family transcriptional regulator, mexJK operon transcriptional repressor
MTGTSRLGRPPKGSESARRDALLDAALAVFAAKGFGAATMDEIARRAGAAKRTLYEAFGTKDRVFEAAIAREAGAILRPFAASAAGDLRTALTEAAFAVLTRIHTREKAAIHRMVVAEARAFPRLATIFHATGPGAGVALVAAALKRAAERGEVRCADPRAAARRLLSLLMGEAHLRLVLGLAKPPTKTQAAREAKSIVDFFLRALA